MPKFMGTINKKWISVYEFSKKRNTLKQNIYMDIRLGKIPPEKVRKARFVNDLDPSQVFTRIQLLWEEEIEEEEKPLPF